MRFTTTLTIFFIVTILLLGIVSAQDPCTDDADCTTSPFTRCKTSENICVECLTNDDCDEHPEGFFVCDLTNNRCVKPDIGPKCEDDDDCVEEGKPRCKVDDRDTANNICVECLTNNDCSKHSDTDGRVKCSTVTNTCVKETHCEEDVDCESVDGKPYCHKQTDTSKNECVECLENSHCDNGQVCNPQTYTCGDTATTPITRLDIKFSRFPNLKKKDPNFDAIVARVVAASADNDACKIVDPESFVTVAKRTWGYYLIGSGCTDKDAQHIEDVANKQSDDDADDDTTTDDTETAKVTVDVGVVVHTKDYSEECVDHTTRKVECAASGNEKCTLPCPNGTPCTKDNEDKICGSYQECKIVDEATTGVCNGSNALTSFIAFVIMNIVLFIVM